MSEKSPKNIKNTCKTNIYKFRANSKKAQQVNPSPFKSAQVPWTYFFRVSIPIYNQEFLCDKITCNYSVKKETWHVHIQRNHFFLETEYFNGWNHTIRVLRKKYMKNVHTLYSSLVNVQKKNLFDNKTLWKTITNYSAFLSFFKWSYKCNALPSPVVDFDLFTGRHFDCYRLKKKRNSNINQRSYLAVICLVRKVFAL